MNETRLAVFENHNIRRYFDEKTEIWYFSVVDIIQVLIEQPNYQTARKYWNKLKERLKKEGSESVTNCHQLKMEAADGKKYLTDAADPETWNKLTDYWKDHKITKEDEYAYLTNIIHQEWSGVSVKNHKDMKGLKTQNLRDHMSEAELIFTALAELSTRQIAESVVATGITENTDAGKKGGKIARKARLELEAKTGKSVITFENFLPPVKKQKQLK